MLFWTESGRSFNLSSTTPHEVGLIVDIQYHARSNMPNRPQMVG